MTKQSIPILPVADQLAGRWTLSTPAASVEIRLQAEPTEAGAAPAWAATAAPEDLAAIGLPGVAAWRPAPDGIALAGRDGLTIAFFSTEAPGRYVARRNGAMLVLSPRGD